MSTHDQQSATEDPQPSGEKGMRVFLTIVGVSEQDRYTLLEKMRFALAADAYGPVTTVVCQPGIALRCNAERTKDQYILLQSAYPQEHVTHSILLSLRGAGIILDVFEDTGRLKPLDLHKGRSPAIARESEDANA